MPTNDLHIVIEMTNEPDCRLIGSWLMKAAEAQALWSEALRDPDFKKRVADLCACWVPSLECAALGILCELQQRGHVLAADLYEDEIGVFSIAFGMMVQLGFFTLGRRSYHMTIPETVTLQSVQQAALGVLSTGEEAEDGLEIVQPERLLYTLPKAEAESWRLRLIEMYHFDSDAPRNRTLQ
jgi:hypothetical protein